jgi:hypothetical protein
VTLIQAIHPGYLLGILLVLITSQLLYVFYPHRGRRRYLVALVTTTIGFVLGQLWALAGLPSVQLGDVNLIPGLALAVGAHALTDLALARLRRRATTISADDSGGGV